MKKLSVLLLTVVLLVGFLYMLFRPYKESKSLKVA